MQRLIVRTGWRAPPWAGSPCIVSCRRHNSTRPDTDILFRLQSDLKSALKSKDSLSATTIRSVLSEVYAGQKRVAPATLKPSDVISIVRKAQQRRLDSMSLFQSASRSDLAQREEKEAGLLASYLPAMLATTEIDTILRRIISESPEKDNVKKAKGMALKDFYTQVDKNVVPGEVVRQRLDELWPS
ncbi:GatB/YqeY domain-containing protein [Gautieria morchelliformis]|nr:GatB/YqeY domain-containing protein [Gautieria morchelliformis]